MEAPAGLTVIDAVLIDGMFVAGNDMISPVCGPQSSANRRRPVVNKMPAMITAAMIAAAAYGSPDLRSLVGITGNCSLVRRSSAGKLSVLRCEPPSSSRCADLKHARPECDVATLCR